MRKILGSIAVAFALLVVGTVPAQAEAPSPSVSSNITDKSGKLDTARVNLLINQVQAETDYELYVYVTDSLSGMSGAQWSIETARKSKLDANHAVLFVIATQDRKYGTAYPTGSSLASKISTVESAAIPAMKSGDWNAAVEAYGNKLISASHGVAEVQQVNNENMNNAVAGFFGFLLLLIEIAAGIAVLIVAFIFGRRGILAVMKNRKEAKERNAEIAKLNATLPGMVSKVDNDLNAVNEQISFASAMDGEKLMEKAVAFAKSASANLQKAITQMGEVSKTNDPFQNVRDLKFSKSFLTSASADIASAQSVLDDVKAQQDSVNAKAEEIKETVTASASKIAKAEADVATLSKSFDADYIVDIRNTVERWKSAVAELGEKVAGVSATTDFPKAKKTVGEAGAIEAKVKALSTKFGQDMIAVAEFGKTRDLIVARHMKAMKSNASINGHARIAPAYAEAVEALSVAEAISGNKGNPGKELGVALAPVEAYLSAVKSLASDKRSVADAKQVAVSQLAQKWGEIDTLAKSVKEYGIALSASDKADLSEAVVMTSGKFKELRAKANMVETYDTKGIAAVTEEIKTAIAEVDAKVKVAKVKVAVVEKQKAEERRIEEERQRAIKEEAKREAERKRRKRQQEEEEEAAARRRRSSSSSSSYSGYSSSYSDYSSSSSSSFSSSGGSFGDSGSGGSF